MNKIVLKEIFASAILVAILHQIALSFYFYWTTDWYDIMMHFLGGVVIAFSAFTFFISIFGKRKNGADFGHDFWLNFCFTVGGVFIIGLGWELWELYVGFSDPQIDQLDSILDIIMDLIGAIFAFTYSFKKLENVTR